MGGGGGIDETSTTFCGLVNLSSIICNYLVHFSALALKISPKEIFIFS